MRAVRVSYRVALKARDNLACLARGEGTSNPDELVRLVQAFDAALKVPRAVKAARPVRAAKKKARKERVAELRAQVFERAQGVCEAVGCSGRATDLDHFWGGSNRRALESLEGCWAVCRRCHRYKTDSFPNRAEVLRWFLEHSARHLYHAEPQRKAQAELDALTPQGRGVGT